MAKFHFLIAFTSRDIGQYVYYNRFCLFFAISLPNYPCLSNQVVLLHESQDNNLNNLRRKRAFEVK